MSATIPVNQVYAVVNAINKAAKGGDASIVAVDSTTFLSVANTLRQCSSDVILDAITQVLTNTIYSVRPYNRKFAGLKVDAERFGNITRKLNVIDGQFIAGEFDIPADGSSVDQWTIKRPAVLEVNFYGQNNFVLQHPTIFRNQLNIAFSSEEELGRFWSMVTQNANDLIEQAHENLARNTVSAFIATKQAGDSGNVINLLAEYLEEHPDSELTAATAANDRDFVKWSYARINTISDFMTERSEKFHQNVTGKVIARHTPKERQKFYIYAPFMNKVKTMTLSSTYNKEDLSIGDVELVNYWQNINDPMAIDMKVQKLKADGTLDTKEEVSMDGVLGILFDEDAMGYTTFDNYVLSTPMNAKGSYTNMFYHFTDRYWMDMTENAVVFIIADED